MNRFLATFLFALSTAKAEADPQLLGNTGLGHGFPLSGLGYRTGYPLSGFPYAAPGYLSPNYAGLAFSGLGYNSGFGLNPAHPLNTLAAPPVVHMAKREAEAEADAYYGPFSLAHTGYGAGYGYGAGFGLGLGYRGVDYPHLGYAGFGLGTPFQIAPAGIVPSASLNIAHLAPSVGGAYAGARRYIGNSGVVHIAKREAEAQYGGYGLGYSGFPAGAGYGFGGLAHLGYGYAAPGYHPGYGYPGLSFSGLGYTRHGYAGLGYAPGNIGAPVEAAGQSSKSTSSSQTILGDAPAAIPAVRGGYAAAGRYLANSAGVVHAA